MARNEEKAFTLFNKWQTFKKDFHSISSHKRPLLASECDSLVDAEKWRRELIRDLTKKIAAIRNANLGEHKLRELNDEINKIIRQKHYWEIRIKELGGIVPIGKQYYDIEGKELPGTPGYKYYGAAKDLPGVRELFAEEENEQLRRKTTIKKRSRIELYKSITPDYYGYRDDEDGLLEPLEQQREEELQRTTNLIRSSSQQSEHGEQLEENSSDEEIRQLQGLNQIAPSILKTLLQGHGNNSEEKDELTMELQRQRQLEEEEAIVEKRKQALLKQFL